MSRHEVVRVITALVTLACSRGPSDVPSLKTQPSSSSEASGLTVPEFAPPQPEIRVSISVIEALAQPERYNGRKVKLAGVFNKNLVGIFATREHAKLNLAEYGVAFSSESCESPSPNSWKITDLAVLDGEYVRVEGTLSTRVRGSEHSIFRIGICDVRKVLEAGFLYEDFVIKPTTKAPPTNARVGGSTR